VLVLANKLFDWVLKTHGPCPSFNSQPSGLYDVPSYGFSTRLNCVRAKVIWTCCLHLMHCRGRRFHNSIGNHLQGYTLSWDHSVKKENYWAEEFGPGKMFCMVGWFIFSMAIARSHSVPTDLKWKCSLVISITEIC
jgi:hypothetical protein